MQFYDSITGKELFRAPISRNFEQFLSEGREQGYLSFRDNEVNWKNVRILQNGTLASIDGTFLGVVSPLKDGNRYAVNLSAVAGNPPEAPSPSLEDKSAKETEATTKLAE